MEKKTLPALADTSAVAAPVATSLAPLAAETGSAAPSAAPSPAPASTPPPPPAPAAEINAFSLLWRAFLSWLSGLFGKGNK